MCTLITWTLPVVGAGKGVDGWFEVTEATTGYDHPSSFADDHAILIDFTNRARGVNARVAVELDLQSGRALRDLLDKTIRAAEDSEFAD